MGHKMTANNARIIKGFEWYAENIMTDEVIWRKSLFTDPSVFV